MPLSWWTNNAILSIWDDLSYYWGFYIFVEMIEVPAIFCLKKKKVELFPIKIKKKMAASLEIIEGCVVSYP